MVDGLFGNMSVGNMTVNVNMPGSNGRVPNTGVPMDNAMNQMRLQQHGHQHLGLPNSTNDPMALPYKEADVVTHEFEFDKAYIDSEWNIKFKKEFDMKRRRPRSKHDLINSSYVIASGTPKNIIEQDPIETGSPIGMILERDNNPFVVFLLDMDDVEDKSLIDDILFHASLLTKAGGHESFFLITDESGSIGFGEPYTTVLDPKKGLFRRTSYNITLPATDDLKNK